MKDFSLQGKVYLGNNVGGKPQAMRWVHDAGLLQLTATAEEEQRRESYTGNRGISATIGTGNEVSFSLTLNHGTAINLALGLYGESRTITAGSVTGEQFPAGLLADDFVMLDRGGVSDVTIEDSTTPTATELVEGTHYSIDDADGGVIKILDPDTLTQPFLANYEHLDSLDVTMFTQKPPVRYLMMTGMNTVDGSNDKIRVRLYRLKFNPIGTLDLINNTFGEIALTGTALMDTNNEADAALGGYGRIELLGDAA